MSKDTVLQSYENLLSYATEEHEADHKSGFCDDAKPDCLTCNWLAVAEENYQALELSGIAN